MAEYIKVYPTQGLADRTPENYWNAFRNYLLADEDVSAKFDISEYYIISEATTGSNNLVGFKISPKNIGNSTSFCIGGYENGVNCGLMNVYFGDSERSILTGRYSSSSLTSDLPLILIKDEGLVLFAVGNIQDAVLFVDMTNTYSGQTVNYMFAFSASGSYIYYAPTGTDSAYLNNYFQRINVYEHYLLYPFILDGFTHKALYLYDGGEIQLAAGNRMIDNKKYAILGRTGAINARGNQVLICLEENSGGGSASDAKLGTKTVTENGIYNAADDELDGYSKVNVNVSPPELITKTITESGTYSAADDGADGYSEVVVDIPTSGGYRIWETTETVNMDIPARSSYTYGTQIYIPEEYGVTDNNYIVEVTSDNVDKWGKQIPYVTITKSTALARMFVISFMTSSKLEAGFEIHVKVAIPL